VEIIQEGTWHFIQFDGGGGYVHSNYVYVGESPPGTETHNTNTSQTWTHLESSAEISVEKIFYDGATYYAADIKTPAENILTLSSEEAKTPGEMLDGRDTAFAVNGDYYGIRDGGVIIRNGELLRDREYSDIAVLYESGRLDVYSGNEKSALELLDGGALQSWSFGPILVEGGKANDDFDEYSDLNLPNPRTGIGMIEPGHYIIIVADGRQESSRGLTLYEFAKLFEEYGCETAYNLDGGGTSVMYFENERISSPSGIEEREVSDIIYIE
jgi:exopolysaccharide biosynthesis protein